MEKEAVHVYIGSFLTMIYEKPAVSRLSRCETAMCDTLAYMPWRLFTCLIGQETDHNLFLLEFTIL